MKKILIVLSLLSGTILSAEEFVINFDEYNAKHKNSFAAIREVIDLVRSKNGEPVKIEFNQKVYNVEKDLNSSWFFHLVNLKNLTIDGKGAKLMIDPSNAYCVINNCENVTLKNFEFEHNRLAFTQGDIVEVTDEYFVLKLDDGYPEFPSHEFVMKNFPGPQWMWGSYMDRQERTLMPNYPDHIFFKTIVPAEKPRHYKFYPMPGYMRHLKIIRTGVAFVMPIHQDPNNAWKNSHGPYTISVVNSKNILVKNVTARATRHAGWAICLNEGKVTFKNCVVTWRENSNDLISSWRDGSHCKNNRIGPSFIGCKWEGLLDDSINIGASPSMITEDLGDATYRIYGGQGFKKGAKIGILIPSKGIWLEGKDWYVEDYSKGVAKLSKPIPDLVCRQKISQYEIISGRGGKNAAATQIYALDYVSEKYVIRNCEFGKQRRYSMILRSPNGVIENNKIYGGTGIILSNELGSWYEGPFPMNTKVYNNTFEKTWGNCQLRIQTNLLPNVKSNINYNIFLRNNTFKLDGLNNKYAVSVDNVAGIKFRGNKYYNAGGEPILQDEAVMLKNTSDISLTQAKKTEK